MAAEEIFKRFSLFSYLLISPKIPVEFLFPSEGKDDTFFFPIWSMFSGSHFRPLFLFNQLRSRGDLLFLLFLFAVLPFAPLLSEESSVERIAHCAFSVV